MLGELQKEKMTLQLLRETKVGKTVSELTKVLSRIVPLLFACLCVGCAADIVRCNLFAQYPEKPVSKLAREIKKQWVALAKIEAEAAPDAGTAVAESSASTEGPATTVTATSVSTSEPMAVDAQTAVVEATAVAMDVDAPKEGDAATKNKAEEGNVVAGEEGKSIEPVAPVSEGPTQSADVEDERKPVVTEAASAASAVVAESAVGAPLAALDAIPMEAEPAGATGTE